MNQTELFNLSQQLFQRTYNDDDLKQFTNNLKICLNSDDDCIRYIANDLLIKLVDHDQFIEILKLCLNDDDENIQYIISELLPKLENHIHFTEIFELCVINDNKYIQYWTPTVLNKVKNHVKFPSFFERLLKNDNPKIRYNVSKLLFLLINTKKFISLFKMCLNDKCLNVRDRSLKILKSNKLNPIDFLKCYKLCLYSNHRDVQIVADELLIRLIDHDEFIFFLKMCFDNNKSNDNIIFHNLLIDLLEKTQRNIKYHEQYTTIFELCLNSTVESFQRIGGELLHTMKHHKRFSEFCNICVNSDYSGMKVLCARSLIYLQNDTEFNIFFEICINDSSTFVVREAFNIIQKTSCRKKIKKMIEYGLKSQYKQSFIRYMESINSIEIYNLFLTMHNNENMELLTYDSK